MSLDPEQYPAQERNVSIRELTEDRELASACEKGESILSADSARGTEPRRTIRPDVEVGTTGLAGPKKTFANASESV